RGETFALKLYAPPDSDGRDRLAAEVDALALMRACGIANVAGVVATDPARHGALLTWLDGEPVTAPGDADIDAAGESAAALHALRAGAVGRAFRRPAAEACLSGREVERQVRARLAALLALDSEPALARSLRDAFAPAFASLLARAERAY